MTAKLDVVVRLHEHECAQIDGALGWRNHPGSSLAVAFHAVDDIDRAIIDQLRRNGRLTNLELSGRVGLSPSPCLRRVRQLEEEGIIRGYTTIVDAKAIGRAYEPLVWVTLSEVDPQ